MDMRTRRVGAIAAALLALLSMELVSWAQRLDSDPVEELRQALQVKVTDPNNPDEVAFRKANLGRRLKALTTLGDMRKALSLQEWKDDDRDIGPIDAELRKQLADRLAAGLRTALQRGDQTAQLAAITLIGEMGSTVRDIAPAKTGYARSFGPDLVALVKGPDPVVSAAAARSLGRINADPEMTARALGELFSTGDFDQRRAAAQALISMVRTVALLAKGRTTTGVEAYKDDVATVGARVVPMAARGVADREAEVRRLSLEAIQAAAVALADQVAPPRAAADLPPEGRKLAKEERAIVDSYRAEVEEERKILSPLTRALAEQAGIVAGALHDQAEPVRHQAARALEDMGFARQQLQRRAASVPRIPGESCRPGPRRILAEAGYQNAVASAALVLFLEEEEQRGLPAAADPLGQALRKTVPDLAKRLADPDVRVRLAALDALEMLPEDLAPVAPVLVTALCDPDRFVRWTAARVLSKAVVRARLAQSPLPAVSTAIPALTRLLCDPDLDVRVQGAADALASYGSYAAPAVPALAAAVNKGDAESRIAMMRTLVAIGPAAASATPAMAQELTNPDARVRRAAAASLGQFGPAASAAIPALRQALFDIDEEVRRNAADALLSIIPAPGK
jgi:HEAT repeat protein